MIGLVIAVLLIGSIIFSTVRFARGGPFFDPGPRSIKEMLEQRRTIVHPDDDLG